MSLFDPPPPPEPEDVPEPGGSSVLSVSELIAEVKDLLARAYPEVWVRGEISSFHHHGSGHMYFKLKDAQAMLDCAFFKFQQRGLRFVPRDGMEVEARAVPDLYPARGAFQLRILEMRPAGIGALLLAFEALKKKLAAEGLFDAARKRPLPVFPRAIGIVTSPAGAAVRDMIHVLRRRWPGLRIVLAPVPVQGEGAAAAVAGAIARLNRLGGLDLVIVGRGGGSLEDLWAFNEEVAVRAIAASALPVLSAVGHEVDFTLADFAADVRAATPSAAAELVTTPDRVTVRRDVRQAGGRMLGAIEAALAHRATSLASLRRTYGFRRPADLIANFLQRVDEQRERLALLLTSRLRSARADVRELTARVHPGRLVERVAAAGRDTAKLAARLGLARETALAARLQRVGAARARLFALSPRAVLARGYSLVTLADGTVVHRAEQLAVGEAIAVEFAVGRANARVESTTRETRK